MKCLLLLILISGTFSQGGFSQIATAAQYPDYEVVISDSVRLYMCPHPKECQQPFIPHELTKSEVIAALGVPNIDGDYPSHDPYYYYLSDNGKATAGYCMYYDSLKKTVVLGFLKSGDNAKLCQVRLSACKYVLRLNNITLNSETTIRDAARLFPLSYQSALADALKYNYGQLYLFAEQPAFRLILRADPSLYEGSDELTPSPNPYWALYFIGGKLDAVGFHYGT